MRAIIERRVIGQRGEGNVANDFAIEFQHHVAGVGHFADHREIQFPLAKDRLGHRLLAGLQHHEHALLAFREHHFVRRHAFFAAGYHIHVEYDASLAVCRHFNRR